MPSACSTPSESKTTQVRWARVHAVHSARDLAFQYANFSMTFRRRQNQSINVRDVFAIAREIITPSLDIRMPTTTQSDQGYDFHGIKAWFSRSYPNRSRGWRGGGQGGGGGGGRERRWAFIGILNPKSKE